MGQGFLVGGECHLRHSVSPQILPEALLGAGGCQALHRACRVRKGLSRDSCWDWGWEDTSRTEDERLSWMQK